MNLLAVRRAIMQLRIVISSHTQHSLLSKLVIFWKVFFPNIISIVFIKRREAWMVLPFVAFFNGNFPSPPNVQTENIAPHNLMSKHKMCALTSFLSLSAFLHPSIILSVLPFVDRLRAFLSALFLRAAKGSGYQQSE